MSSNELLEEFLIYYIIPMHNWCYIWLRLDELWEGTCTVEKWLHDFIYQPKHRHSNYGPMPPSNQS